MERRRYTETFRNVQLAQAQLYEATFRDKPKANANIVSLVKTQRRRLEAQFGKGGGGMPKYVPILDLTDDLGQAVGGCRRYQQSRYWVESPGLLNRLSRYYSAAVFFSSLGGFSPQPSTNSKLA